MVYRSAALLGEKRADEMVEMRAARSAVYWAYHSVEQ